MTEERTIHPEEMLDQLLFSQMLLHPLPWRVEPDWTQEVVASDGATIAKCADELMATSIVEAAAQLQASLEAEWALIACPHCDDGQISTQFGPVDCVECDGSGVRPH